MSTFSDQLKSCNITLFIQEAESCTSSKKHCTASYVSLYQEPRYRYTDKEVGMSDQTFRVQTSQWNSNRRRPYEHVEDLGWSYFVKLLQLRSIQYIDISLTSSDFRSNIVNATLARESQASETGASVKSVRYAACHHRPRYLWLVSCGPSLNSFMTSRCSERAVSELIQC